MPPGKRQGETARIKRTFTIDCQYKTKFLYTYRHVIRNGTFYLYEPPVQAGFEPVVWEFQRLNNNRWKCTGIGRHDLPQYAGMFPAEGTSSL